MTTDRGQTVLELPTASFGASPHGAGLARASARRSPHIESRARVRKIKSGGVGTYLFALSVILATVAGFWTRDSTSLTPSTGAGYWLGIVGGCVMLSVLAYPMRKHLSAFRSTGTMAGWFRFHMLAGLVGPLIVLFHSNFRLGATNSTVAVLSMLIVAGSGVVGRYLYGRIHHGLYGARAIVREEIAEASGLRNMMARHLPWEREHMNEIDDLEQSTMMPVAGLMGAVLHTMSLSRARRRVRRRVLASAKALIVQESRHHGLGNRQRRAWNRQAVYDVDAYFAALSKAADLLIFERLFSLWHVLHVPLFVLLIITSIIHVVAVHFY
jgi:hypothetical protein